jgi:hypothetical protein
MFSKVSFSVTIKLVLWPYFYVELLLTQRCISDPHSCGCLFRGEVVFVYLDPYEVVTKDVL